MPILIGKGKNRKAYIRNSWLIVLCQVQSRKSVSWELIVRRLRRAKALPANRLGTSKSTAIFNPPTTTPIHVRYRRRLHHYKRLLSLFLTVLIVPNLV